MAAKKKQTTTSSRPKAKAAKKPAVSGPDPILGKSPGQSIQIASTSGKQVSLADFKGQVVVLYFYPKDNTPGCTTEGLDFRKLQTAFKKQGCVILGVSRDSISSHQKFKSGCEFPFDLLSDESEELCRAFDVIREKSLYGRKYMGVDRSTFVLDEAGKVLQAWRAVKVPGHAEEVLEFVRSR